jgi:hypothetical protein
MTKDNDLVKKLRAAAKHPLMDNNCKADVFDVSDAADRIEALEEEITEVNAAWEQTSIMLGRQLARASDLEAKLAKALEAFDRIAGKAPYADDPYDIARATLAELKGDKP